MRVILASGSENRKKALSWLGIDFEVVPSSLDEKKFKFDDPGQKALGLAKLKADDIAKNHQGIIIACDTFTTLNGEILEKPQSKKEAIKMLKKLSAQTAIGYTGLSIVNTQSPKDRFDKLSKIKVYFRKLNDQEIEKTVENEPVMDWAAAYRPYESRTASFVGRVEGSLMGLVLGIPLDQVAQYLNKLPHHPGSPSATPEV